MTPTVRPPPPSTPPAASSSPRGLGTSATKATGDPTGHYSAADYEAAVFAEREYGVPLPAEMVLPPTTTPIEDTYNGWDEIGSMHQASTRPDIDDTYNGLDEINAMHEATTRDLYCRARQAGPAGNNVNELGGLAGDGPAVAPTRSIPGLTSQGREDWCRATVPVGPCSFSVRPQPLNLDVRPCMEPIDDNASFKQGVVLSSFGKIGHTSSLRSSFAGAFCHPDPNIGINCGYAATATETVVTDYLVTGYIDTRGACQARSPE